MRMGRYLDLLDNSPAAAGVRTRAGDQSDQNDQRESGKDLSSLSSLMSQVDALSERTNRTPMEITARVFREPPFTTSSQGAAAGPPPLLADPGPKVAGATKAIKATKPPLQSLSSLMSRSASDDLDPRYWHELHEERSAFRQYDGGYCREEAERLAWGELQNRWHMARGERVPNHVCAGCRCPTLNGETLDLIDGCRVHVGGGEVDCLVLWGEHWRSAATLALMAMGLRPPRTNEQAP
jgi:hypothetical protein